MELRHVPSRKVTAYVISSKLFHHLIGQLKRRSSLPFALGEPAARRVVSFESDPVPAGSMLSNDVTVMADVILAIGVTSSASEKNGKITRLSDTVKETLAVGLMQ